MPSTKSGRPSQAVRRIAHNPTQLRPSGPIGPSPAPSPAPREASIPAEYWAFCSSGKTASGCCSSMHSGACCLFDFPDDILRLKLPAARGEIQAARPSLTWSANSQDSANIAVSRPAGFICVTVITGGRTSAYVSGEIPVTGLLAGGLVRPLTGTADCDQQHNRTPTAIKGAYAVWTYTVPLAIPRTRPEIVELFVGMVWSIHTKQIAGGTPQASTLLNPLSPVRELGSGSQRRRSGANPRSCGVLSRVLAVIRTRTRP
jgi:hypothetical protein